MQLLQCLKQTINDKRIIGSDILRQLCTYIDVAYGVHPNLKIHTGGSISFGNGMLHFNPSKYKLNIKLSTEAEVLGVSDYLTYKIWMYLFIGAQVY